MKNPVPAVPSGRRHGSLLVAFAAMAAGGVATAANAQVTVQNLTYLPSNGHWYGRVDSQAISWHVANAQVVTVTSPNGVGGHLMTVRNNEEQMTYRFALGAQVNQVYWLGAIQTGGPEPAGGWVWVTEEPWDYTLFPPNVPNNFTSGMAQQCGDENVIGAWGNTGGWDDYCSASSDPYWMSLIRGYFVEFPSADIIITPGESDTASFTIESHGVVPPTFTMQVESPVGTWVDLSGTPTPLVGGGTATASAPTPLSAQVVFDGASGDFQVRAKGTNAFETVYSNVEVVTVGGPACDSIDFNGDGFFPDTADIDDYLSVFSGGPCSTGTCGDTDFNNDGLFPDTLDIDALLSVFSGGPCL